MAFVVWHRDLLCQARDGIYLEDYYKKCVYKNHLLMLTTLKEFLVMFNRLLLTLVNEKTGIRKMFNSGY